MVTGTKRRPKRDKKRHPGESITTADVGNTKMKASHTWCFCNNPVSLRNRFAAFRLEKLTQKGKKGKKLDFEHKLYLSFGAF